MKKYLLAFVVMILLFGLTNLNGETYTENFDTNGNWAGGTMTGYNAKTYTNDSAPGSLNFSSNSAVRETGNVNSALYSWRVDDNAGFYLMADMNLTVNGFSVQMARWDNDKKPSVDIKYSIDGGTTYTLIEAIDGDIFSGDKTYQLYSHTFASPISPATGSTVVIMFNTTYGERMLYDDFTVVYSTDVNSLPSITNVNHTPNLTITSSTTVSVSADITDSDGTIEGAELHWGTSEGVLETTINMTVFSENTYKTDTDIPVQLDGTTVYYEIYALDNESGESTSPEANYEVKDPEALAVNFEANVTTAYVGQAITFTSTTTGGYLPYSSYLWNFGDGNTLTDEAPTYTYNGVGSYTVSLKVTDGNSDTDVLEMVDYIIVSEAPTGATDLFFSEYIEGSGSNKAIEIFNGTGLNADLSDYSVKIAYNEYSFSTVLSLSGTLANNEVYVIYNSSSAQAIIDAGDIYSGIATFNGNDALGLFKNGNLIDIIGVEGSNSNQSVAGTSNATAEHTLVRKPSVLSGNTDWASSAGTEAKGESEWIVYDQDYFDNLGSHQFDGDQTLPVTFASFMAVQTSENYAELTWVTHSESGIAGYNVLRSEIEDVATAIKVNTSLVVSYNSSTTTTYNYTDTETEMNITYYYWLESSDFNGSTEMFGPVTIKLGENNDTPEIVIPTKTALRSVYPNPFNPSTSVSFYMDKTDNVKINVYNVKGQLINSITEGSFEEGFHNVTWNGRDLDGQECASGIYFFRMETATENQMIKGILLK